MNKLLLPILMMATLCSFGQSPAKRIDDLFKSIYEPDKPGVAVSIEWEGKIIFEKGYGLANMQTREKNTIAGNFNIGSLTKQFTAVGILILASEHKLSLNDKLIKFFPDYHANIGNRISIRQLLTHSSGILDHYAYVDTQMIKHATDKDVLNAVMHLDSTYFTPGTQYRYSNTAYCLLAMIIEKISGMSYPEFIRKHIFQPLGMVHSQVLQVGHSLEKRVLGYDSVQNGFKRLDADDAIFFSTEGDGGIYTSAVDYVKWFNALQRGKLLSKKWIEKARSGAFPVDPKNHLSYGFGWFVHEQGQLKEVYHTGSNGGFRAIAYTLPSKNYLVVILSNRTGVDLENIIQEINKILKVGGKSYTKIDALESFNNSSLIFAPCKETI